MYNRLKNLKAAEKKRTEEEKQNQQLQQISPQLANDIDMLCSFFETCALPANKNELLVKLKESAALRQLHQKQGSKIYASSRHLFVVDPQLVSPADEYSEPISGWFTHLLISDFARFQLAFS